MQLNDTVTAGVATPLYPVLRYGHGQDGGNAIRAVIGAGERLGRETRPLAAVRERPAALV